MNDPELRTLLGHKKESLFEFLDRMIRLGWISDYNWREESAKHKKGKRG